MSASTTSEQSGRMPGVSPAGVVQTQFDAYNAKRLDDLLDTYAADAEQRTLHGSVLAHGRDQMHARFAERFSEPDLHARLLSRTCLANFVVDHEVVTRNFAAGRGTVEMLCIYEVKDGRIQTAWFALGEPCMDRGGGEPASSN